MDKLFKKIQHTKTDTRNIQNNPINIKETESII